MSEVRIVDAMATGRDADAAAIVFEYVALTQGEVGRPVPGDGGGRGRLHRHTGLDTERPADPNSKQDQDDPTPRH